MLAGAGESAGNHSTVRGAHHEAARAAKQGAATPLLERVPQGVRPLHEGHVERMLKVGFANNARAPV